MEEDPLEKKTDLEPIETDPLENEMAEILKWIPKLSVLFDPLIPKKTIFNETTSKTLNHITGQGLIYPYITICSRGLIYQGVLSRFDLSLWSRSAVKI
jgi:hypothetical protein